MSGADATLLWAQLKQAGLVEGVRLDSSESFLLAVQWHPEWKVMENPFYLRIFQAFGDACRARAAQRTEK